MIAPIDMLTVVSGIFMLAVRAADYVRIRQTESLLAANDKELLHAQKKLARNSPWYKPRPSVAGRCHSYSWCRHYSHKWNAWFVDFNLY